MSFQQSEAEVYGVPETHCRLKVGEEPSGGEREEHKRTQEKAAARGRLASKNLTLTAEPAPQFEFSGLAMAEVAPSAKGVGERHHRHSESHDVVSTIHVDGFASDSAGRIAGEEDGCCADLFDVHVALQRSPAGVRREHIA